MGEIKGQLITFGKVEGELKKEDYTFFCSIVNVSKIALIVF